MPIAYADVCSVIQYCSACILHLLDDGALARLASAEQQKLHVLRGLHAVLLEHLLDLPALLDRLALLRRHRAPHRAALHRSLRSHCFCYAHQVAAAVAVKVGFGFGVGVGLGVGVCGSQNERPVVLTQDAEPKEDADAVASTGARLPRDA